MTKKKNEIRQGIDHMMNEIRRETMTDDIYVAVKGHGNFRKDIFPEYKANRPTLQPDLKKALEYAHKYMVDKHGAIMANGMEADDLVSIWAYECMGTDKDYVVVGIDKDLLQIPGNHYNFVKKEHVDVDNDTADYNLMRQCLVGDTSDNIKGIKGIGVKKAERILYGVPAKRRWNRVKAAYRKHAAGSPTLVRDLLSMLKSFEDLETINDRYKTRRETTVS